VYADTYSPILQEDARDILLSNGHDLHICILVIRWMLCIALRAHWCDIIFLSVLAPTEDKTDYIEDNICKELEHVFHHPELHVEILLRELNSLKWREDISKATISNEN
jgi:hypothetical protein